jgi:hypothetical protein
VGGGEDARLSPGFSVGHVDVEGNYRQGTAGVLEIDVEGDAAGQFDTVAVEGEIELDGIARIDASLLANKVAGIAIEVVTAVDGLEVDAEFENVETIGGQGIYFAPEYAADSVAFASFLIGDMNRSGGLDEGDINEFALGLMNATAYRALRGLFPSQSGNMDGVNGLDFSDIDEFAAALELAQVPNALAAIHRALAAVPEPHTCVLMMLAVLCGGSLGRRRSRIMVPLP